MRPTPLSTGTRSRIRHDLLPKLAAEYNPEVERALVRLGALSGSLDTRSTATPGPIARDATVSAAENAVVLKHGFLRSTSAIDADGNSATGLEARGLARGQHVSPALAPPGGVDSQSGRSSPS